jgi:hypothetical protein
MHQNCEECSLDNLLCNIKECLTLSCYQNVLDLGEWSFSDVENILFEDVNSYVSSNPSFQLGCLQMHQMHKSMQLKWQKYHQYELQCIYDTLCKWTYISFDDWCKIAYKKHTRMNPVN